MELGTAKVLVQIKGTAGSLEAKGKDDIPLLSPVLLWRITKTVSQNWLGDHFNFAGEVLPFPDKGLLAQYMRSDEKG